MVAGSTWGILTPLTIPPSRDTLQKSQKFTHLTAHAGPTGVFVLLEPIEDNLTPPIPLVTKRLMPGTKVHIQGVPAVLPFGAHATTQGGNWRMILLGPNPPEVEPTDVPEGD